MRRQLLGSPAAPLPSPPSAPHKCLLVLLVLLPVAAGSGPTGSRAHSTPGNSPARLRRPTLPLPVSAPPDAQRVGECTARRHSRPPSRSTPPPFAAAPRRSAVAARQETAPDPPRCPSATPRSVAPTAPSCAP